MAQEWSRENSQEQGVYDKTHNKQHTFPLGKQTTVYQAEVYAIIMCEVVLSNSVRQINNNLFKQSSNVEVNFYSQINISIGLGNRDKTAKFVSSQLRLTVVHSGTQQHQRK